MRPDKFDNLHKGHRERMRAAYRKDGLPSEPHKQLEMLLYYILPRADTNEIAHRLIRRFGSVKSALNANVFELCEIEGIGQTSAEFLRFIGDISKIPDGDFAKKKTLHVLPDREAAEKYFRARLFGQNIECILSAYLDAKGRVIHEHFSKSSIESSVQVENSTRVIVSLALKYRAASVIIGHNHPDADAIPSAKDISESRRTKAALQSVGLKLRDSIIVGEDGEVFTMDGSGLLY